MRIVGRWGPSRYLAGVICLVLSLGLQPGQLSRALNAALAVTSLPAQQARGQGSSEEHHDHEAEGLEGLSQRARLGGSVPTRGWLVLRAALSSRPVTPEPLSAEDVRHFLLPRRTPPPEPEQRRV